MPAASSRANRGDPPTGRGRYRWLVCGLLFFATTVNYLDRQILALLKPALDGELGWTNQQFGQVVGAFHAAYAVGSFLFGWLIDRVGTKIGYAASIAAWSLSAAAHALVASIGGFLGARVALGLGEGGNFPAAIKTVALWFPPGERTRATTLFNSGSNVGAVLAPLFVPALAAAWGWRPVFLAAGAIGLLWLLLWIPLYDVPERARRLTDAERAHIRGRAGGQGRADSGRAIGWGQLLRHRQAWAFIAAKSLTDPIWWFLLVWLPDFFKKTRGLDVQASWPHLAAIYGLVTVLSLGGAGLTDTLIARGVPVGRARKASLLGFAACVSPIVLVTQAGNWGAVVLIGIAAAAHQAWSANLMTSASDMFPAGAVARVIALGTVAGSAGGIAFPILTGRLLDGFQATGQAAVGYGILFAIGASAYLVAFALHHALAPRFEPIVDL